MTNVLALMDHVADAVIGRDPFLLPAGLVVLGLLALLWASVRRRLPWQQGRRLVVASYLCLGIVCGLTGGGVLGYRSLLFWGVHGTPRELVLSRLGPLADVHLARAQVLTVTEYGGRERTLTGTRARVQFIVRTRGGRTYWSAPLYRRADADAARTALLAGGARFERFLVGSATLPD